MNYFKRLVFTLLTSLFVVSGYSTNLSGIKISEGNYLITISCINNKTIHVQVYPKDSQHQFKSMVVDSVLSANIGYKEADEIETDLLIVRYNRELNQIRFIDKISGETILSEASRDFKPTEVLGDKAYNISQTFSLTKDEGIYGLGQFQEGILNYRGRKAYLVHANREIANPVLVSTKKYILFWDNYSKTLFSDNNNGATFWSEMGDGIDYYFVYGHDMKDAVAGFRQLTGDVPMLPKSSFGFWVSRERYRSFDELVGVVSEYRKRNIPIDNIVQDWQYWGGSDKHELWNNMKFSPEKFANPKEVIEGLHNKYNVKITISVWPCAGVSTNLYRKMDSINALFDIPTWAGYKVIDIYNPQAQKIYYNQLYNGLYTTGIDGWWMDATEPSFRDGLYQDKQEEWSKKAGMTYIGPFHRYLNSYSLALSQTIYENLRKQNNKRVSILTRSAFAGQQKYGTSVWSGDIYASWNVFKKQIPAALNLCMTGIPYWTSDIGGFRVKSKDNVRDGATGELSDYLSDKVTSDGGYVNGLADPAYLELYTRWFQFGAFNPMFRIHGTEVPREIWYFGEPGTPYYDAQVEMINMRYSFLSYIYSTSWQVTSCGGSMMRALVMDFTNDKKVYNNADAYMFGDAILVSPVTHAMYYNRDGKIRNENTKLSLYLPVIQGKYWYDLNSDSVYRAGTQIEYNAPLNVIPLFAKSGSIIPRNKPVQFVASEDYSEMDIFVYTGADAYFTLYEDDNETYDYEKGAYRIIKMDWSDAKKEFVISAPNGGLKSVLKQRKFNVHIVMPSNNRTTVVKRCVVYKNKELKIKI